MADGEVRLDIRATSDQFEAALRRSEKKVEQFDKAATKTANNGVQQIDKRLSEASKQTKAFDTVTAKATTKLGGFGRSAGQAGIQIQQFVGQVQGGVSPMVALSQQAADLGIVLGAPLVGVIAALGASLATVLIPTLFSASEEIDHLTEVADRIRNSTKQWNEEIKNFDTSQLQVDLNESETRVFDLEQQIRLTQKEIERLGEGGFESLQGGQAIVANLNDKIDKLRASIRKEETERASLQGQIELNNLAREQEANLAARSNIEGLIQSLEDQAATMGRSTREIVAYRLSQEAANVVDQAFVATSRQKVNALVDQIETRQAQIDAEREADRAAQAAIRRAQQQARQAQAQVEANDRLVDSLRDRLAVALEEDARKQAILTTAQRLNESATADQRREAEMLAGTLFDVAQAAEAASFQRQMDMGISTRIQDVMAQIQTTEMLTAAIGGTANEMRAAEVAVEKYRLEQELLNQVIQQNGFVTAEQREDIKSSVDAYGQVVDQLFMVQDAQRQAAERQQEFQKGVEDFQSTLAEGLTGIIFNANSAEDALKSMILQISQAIVQAQILKGIQMAMGLGGAQGFGGGTTFGNIVAGAITGSIGGIFGGGASTPTAATTSTGISSVMASRMHTGGSVGSSGQTTARPISDFIDAPRFHNGLAPDEFPAILQRGEQVLSRDEVREERQSRGGRGDVIINVQAKDADSFRQSRRQLAREVKSRGI